MGFPPAWRGLHGCFCFDVGKKMEKKKKTYQVHAYSMHILYDPGGRDKRLVLRTGLQFLLQKLGRERLEQNVVYSLNNSVLE